MPVVSKAQNAAMHAAASGKSTLGIPQKVGAEFTADQAPGSVKKLPQRVKKPTSGRSRPSSRLKRPHRNGQVSERAHERMETKRKERKEYGGKDDMNIPGATA